MNYRFQKYQISLHKIKEEKEQSENKKKELKEEIQTLEKEKVAAEEKVSSSLKNTVTNISES